jgi:U3 small nucleolar RNA-associated protein MPP10
MFSDFFKPPPKPFYSRGDNSNGRPKSSAPRKKAKDIDMDLEEEEEEEEEADGLPEDEDEQETEVKNLFDDNEEQEDGGKSAHEKRLERIKEQIEELEMANVGPKDWTLGGEVWQRASVTYIHHYI